MVKKICILTSVHPVFDTRIFYKEAKTLAVANYNVTIVAQHDKKESIDGIRIVPLPKSSNRLRRFIETDYLTFKKAFQQKADVYHFHDPELLPWAILLKKIKRVKIIYDIHENVPKDILNKKWIPVHLRKSFFALYKKIERLLLPSVDWIVLAEDSYKEDYRYDNVSVIKNYTLIPKIIYKRNKSCWRSPRLVYAGSISERKGLFRMIEAVKEIKENFGDINLKIIGKINEKTEIEAKKMIKNYHLEKEIHLKGRMLYSEILNILKSSNIGINIPLPAPNCINSLPTKIFEYMTAKIPIIISDFPLWKKIVEENECGICINPQNQNDFVDAVKYLINNPDEAKKMGENGRRAVIKNYSWEREGKKLLKIYETI